jgi:hypothetical protein
MHKLILTDEMEEGMVLATSIKNKFGQVLLSAETRLEMKHKSLFKTWGIGTINILSEEGEVSETVDKEILDEVERIFGKRVKWKPKNENEIDILNLGKERLIEKLNN